MTTLFAGAVVGTLASIAAGAVWVAHALRRRPVPMDVFVALIGGLVVAAVCNAVDENWRMVAADLLALALSTGSVLAYRAAARLRLRGGAR